MVVAAPPGGAGGFLEALLSVAEKSSRASGTLDAALEV